LSRGLEISGDLRHRNASGYAEGADEVETEIKKRK
jgi:hypothetical protein